METWLFIWHFNEDYVNITEFTSFDDLVEHQHNYMLYDFYPQDNLLDLEVAKQGPDPKDMEEKVVKISSVLDELQTRYARLLAEHEAAQGKLKRRITKLEKKITDSSGVEITEMAKE